MDPFKVPTAPVNSVAPPPFDPNSAAQPNNAPTFGTPATGSSTGPDWATGPDTGWMNDPNRGGTSGDADFDIGKWIQDFLTNHGGPDTFTAPGSHASDFKAPGAADRITAPEFDFNAPRSDAATEDLLLQLLRNPSAYDDDVIKTTFSRLSGSIDDQYDQENQRIKEDMVRRGLGDSSVYGGKLQDSNVMRRSAKTDLGERILDTAAQTRAADQARAIQTGMQFGDQSFGRQQTAFQDAMQTAGFNRDESQRMFDNALRSAQFGREGQGIDYEQALNTFMANLQSKNLNTSQMLAIVQSFLQYADQMFNHQMDTARFNQDEDHYTRDEDLRRLGL
jgi:hypothetical protein